MKPILKGSYHTEVSASTTNRPEKIRIGFAAGFYLFAIDEDNLRRQQIVAACAMHRHQKAFSPAEREPGHAHVRATTRRRSQPEAHRRRVHVADERTGSRTCQPPWCIYVHSFHRREIDYYAVVAHREPSAT